MYQPDRGKFTVTVDGDKLNSVPEFTYPGSIVSNDGRLDVELQKKMTKSSAAFGRLRR